MNTPGSFELGAISDSSGDFDDRWLILDFLGLFESSFDTLKVGIAFRYVLSMPPVCIKSLEDILGKLAIRITI